MRRAKAVLLSIILFALTVSLFGCGKADKENQYAPIHIEPNRKYDALEGIEEDLLVEYIFDNYSIQELAEMQYGDDWGSELVEELLCHYDLRDLLEMRYGDYYWQYFEDLGIPDIFIVIDELTSQGHADKVEGLKTIADLIGYYPSVIFGNYVADGNHVIHLTNGDCFENIPVDEINTIGPFANTFELKGKIIDDNNWLHGYSLCPICFESNGQ